MVIMVTVWPSLFRARIRRLIRKSNFNRELRHFWIISASWHDECSLGDRSHESGRRIGAWQANPWREVVVLFLGGSTSDD
jgi:hypothetical protein